MTIRSKLILLYSGLLAIIIVAFGIAMFAVTRWVLGQQRGQRTGRHRRSNLVTQPRLRSPRIWQTVANRHRPAERSRLFPRLWRGCPGLAVGRQRSDLLNASTNLSGYSDPIDAAALRREQQTFDDSTGIDSLYTTANIGSGQWRVLTLPLNNIQGRRVVIQAATSFDAVNQASQGLLLIIVVATVAALIGSVMLGLLLANRVLKPIADITRSAAQITAAADLKTRLEWNGPMDELGQLVSVFNKAMERLEHLFTVQQRFVADVSHELRTPLTAISGNVELIKRYGMDQESLDAIESEAQRMSRLVNDLLLLARADNGELKLKIEALDLDIVVGEAYREARILAKDRDLKVTVVDFEPVRIKGDADRLKQLLSNLLSNAIKFTPDGGQIMHQPAQDRTRRRRSGAGYGHRHFAGRFAAHL